MDFLLFVYDFEAEQYLMFSGYRVVWFYCSWSTGKCNKHNSEFNFFTLQQYFHGGQFWSLSWLTKTFSFFRRFKATESQLTNIGNGFSQCQVHPEAAHTNTQAYVCVCVEKQGSALGAGCCRSAISLMKCMQLPAGPLWSCPWSCKGSTPLLTNRAQSAGR